MATNAEVHRVVQAYLDQASGADRAARVGDAWASIQAFRLTHCGYGQEIVAAEHYLWMRHMAGAFPGAFVLAVPLFTIGMPLYDIYKALSRALTGGSYQESDCPPSDPSAWVRAWSYTGLCDGTADGTSGSGPLLAPSEPNNFGRVMVWPYGEPGT